MLPRSLTLETHPNWLRCRHQFPDHVTGATPGTTDYGIITATYDGLGRTVTVTDQNNDTKTMVYDLASRLLERQYPDSLNDVFTYDSASRLLTARRWLMNGQDICVNHG